MSAIAGLVYKNGNPISAGDLERMGEALAAHGQEGGGVWRGAAGLVQRQSWITPEDRHEHQPLVFGRPAAALVSASRLDNRAELARELGFGASEVRAAPDSHFLRQAYLRWGDHCPEHLVGDYTFAVWNEDTQHLFIAVSPFSSRPIHYFDSPHCFAFATMPKGLFALPEIPRVLDEEYASRYLAKVPRSPAATFYRGIRRVLPGQSVVVQGSQVEFRDFWEWESQPQLKLSSDREYGEAFLELYTRVVQDHLRSISPVGIMLSGGLDSASLAAMAAPLLKARNQCLVSYTEVPRPLFALPLASERYSDETTRVQAIAERHPNLQATFLRSSASHFLQDAGTFFQHAEVPFRNACNRPWHEAILGAAQAQGVRVLLTGSQGNLTISWKGTEQRQPWLRRLVSRIRASDGLPPRRPSLLNPDFVKKYKIEPRNWGAASGGSVHAERYKRMQSTAAQSSSLWTGYQAMFGVEVWDPTADERIVRFCLSLPQTQFRQDGVSRRLIRHTMEGRLPPSVLSERRRGLQSADWRLTLVEAAGELRSEFDRITRCELAASLLDLNTLRGSLDELAAAGRNGNPLDISLRNHLEHGLMTGRFLSWFETGE